MEIFWHGCRLTKPILYQNIPEELEKAIQRNRENILITALLFNDKDILNKLRKKFKKFA